MDNKKKLPVIVIAVLAVAAIVAGLLLWKNGKQKGYRLLKIIEAEGTASVVREALGEITPYVNMVLESGDHVSLDKGKLSIQADEDKLIYLQEETEIVLTAEGDGADSRTNIELLKGAITNDIRNPLSKASAYEVNTPNATMSVRGTVFYVDIYVKDGIQYTRVTVFAGEVATRLVYPDGTMSDQEVSVASGREVIIYQDNTTTDYLEQPSEIDYDSIPKDVLKRLLIVTEDEGRELSVTSDELHILIEGPYTVRFMYQGNVFGEQTVKKGELAAVPVLKPAAQGGWDYDFSKPVDSNLEIEWK